MLVLVFTIAGERYALPCREVVEVVPWVPLRAVAKAPRFLAGLLSYRGGILPVIDLGELIAGKPVAAQLATRIMIVRGGEPGRVGALAERVTDAVVMDPTQRRATPLRSSAAGYLGDLIREGDRLTQLIEVTQLLPRPVRELITGGGDDDGGEAAR